MNPSPSSAVVPRPSSVLPQVVVDHRGRLERFAYRDAPAVFALAVALRLIFAALTADRYDPDEFVLLALGRSYAHGAVPYRDFVFFHPPGVLVLVRLLDPLITLWWPLARLLSVLVDSLTAVLVWRIGLQLYGRREAVAAGVLYAVSPITLISGVRVEQDPLITALGTAGLAILLLRGSKKVAVIAGICLACAVWVKYPALVLLPVYAVAARRRAPLMLVGFLAGAAALFGPFVLPDGRLLYRQTIEWQAFHRIPNPLYWRLEKAAIFWLLINPFAVAGLVRRWKPAPAWLLAGYGIGAIFLLSAQVYYHYYVPIVAFAALLAAPVAARLSIKPALVLVAVVAFTAVWAVDIDVNGPGRQFVSATRFSDIRPTVRFAETHTGKRAAILADRFEYAYLSGRAWVPYFWNMADTVQARSPKTLLPRVSMVIRSKYAGGPTYPPGFLQYLDTRFRRYDTPATSVWVVDGLPAKR